MKKKIRKVSTLARSPYFLLKAFTVLEIKSEISILSFFSQRLLDLDGFKKK